MNISQHHIFVHLVMQFFVLFLLVMQNYVKRIPQRDFERRTMKTISLREVFPSATFLFILIPYCCFLSIRFNKNCASTNA